MATHPNPINRLAALACLILLLATPGGQAQDLPLIPPPPPTPAAEGVPSAAVTTPATTNALVLSPPIPEGLTPVSRDPFWPVGYAPKSAAELEREKSAAEASRNKVSGPKWSEARASLRVGGYMKTQDGYAALVNNSVVTPTDVIALIFEDKLYRWKVETVSANGISFIQLDWTSVASKPQSPGKDRP
jgi:hypothetical protein